MKKTTLVFGLCLSMVMNGCSADSPNESVKHPEVDDAGKVAVWVTNGSQTKLLQKENPLSIGKSNTAGSANLININFGTKFQEMEGFGAALTGSSAYLINKKMDATQRAALLKDLFDPEAGIGMSYLRVTMGASDFSLEDFTYNDLPAGQTDAELSKFSIAKDQDDLLPVLKSVVGAQPAIRIMATPWSAPGWMKNNGKLAGGSLKPEWYGAFANYFVKYLDAYKKEGISIDAISVQNEPLHEAAYPSMGMDAAAQNVFIKNHLGPVFKTNGIKAKILLYDHNWDRPDYPIAILSDAQTNPFVTGSAFHAYGGNVSAMSEVHDKFPDKGLYFTEISGGRWATNFSDNLKWNMSNIFIGTANNWSKNALLWNLALDENDGPKNKGCDNCRGVVTIAANGSVVKNVEYYTIAHMSKFIRPGAFRVQSDKFTSASKLESSAFVNTDGSKVLVVLNQGVDNQKFTVSDGANQFNYTIEPNSVATLVWK
ncbi:glycoside hydrolase family 30 beta sandwich domain-containing protein [Dyadobacter sp. CY312]|uniref:glycoside hydrolase family 30 protein n=1 Tax=Dyadobacter sp. CY312 TaxID=2907303 RepID=UPI001F1662D0|nr:glycoside hydrolase family 30 beta sandwich domain-containing protein [Dyadobacter sp. CY312]MCE7042355.1 glucan endo-1,6-beta-glucosidase [Dyadobacter sp. CY312]